MGTTVRKVTANILSVWNTANETNREDGAQWYPTAYQICTSMAFDYGYELDQVVAVMAHLSPRCSWEKNIEKTGAVLAGHSPIGTLGSSMTNALRALTGGVEPLGTLRGPKVKAFAANILGDPEPVTIDVWATRVAGLDSDRISKSQYEAIAHCYRLAARRVGVTPPTMQATTWIVARNGRTSHPVDISVMVP
jgi:hypothetical protein